ncbi:MAG: hypothetical protein R3Y43_07240 [Alphaproteobacteria bacterium]
MNKTILSITSTFILFGCSFSQDALYPSLFTPVETSQEVKETQIKTSKEEPVLTSQANFKPINVAEVKNTGTLVGQKVIAFKNELKTVQKNIAFNSSELKKIKASILSNSANYHSTLAAIESKLQVGTTPGNPEVYAMLNTIQNNIQLMDSNSIALEQVTRRITADADLTSSLLDSIRSTYVVSGAVDEDHRQLRVLENEAAQTSILIQSTLAEINTDYARQVQYSQSATNYVNELSKAVKVGNFTGSVQDLPSYQKPTKAFTKPTYTGATTASALMSINFNNGTPNYKDTLQTTIKEAIKRKSNASFDIVSLNSVSPQNANNIFQEMVNAGANPSNINISAINDGTSGASVQIFVK